MVMVSKVFYFRAKVVLMLVVKVNFRSCYNSRTVWVISSGLGPHGRHMTCECRPLKRRTLKFPKNVTGSWWGGAGWWSVAFDAALKFGLFFWPWSGWKTWAGSLWTFRIMKTYGLYSSSAFIFLLFCHLE